LLDKSFNASTHKRAWAKGKMPREIGASKTMIWQVSHLTNQITREDYFAKHGWDMEVLLKSWGPGQPCRFWPLLHSV
jgi:hypothetical protein